MDEAWLLGLVLPELTDDEEDLDCNDFAVDVDEEDLEEMDDLVDDEEFVEPFEMLELLDAAEDEDPEDSVDDLGVNLVLRVGFSSSSES